MIWTTDDDFLFFDEETRHQKCIHNQKTLNTETLKCVREREEETKRNAPLSSDSLDGSARSNLRRLLRFNTEKKRKKNGGFRGLGGGKG